MQADTVTADVLTLTHEGLTIIIIFNDGSRHEMFIDWLTFGQLLSEIEDARQKN